MGDEKGSSRGLRSAQGDANSRLPFRQVGGCGVNRAFGHGPRDGEDRCWAGPILSVSGAVGFGQFTPQVVPGGGEAVGAVAASPPSGRVC